MLAVNLPPSSTDPDDWTLADVIDFEHALAKLRPSGFEAQPAVAASPGSDRRALLLAWVRQQRATASAASSPGEAFVAGLAAVSVLACGAGLLSGFGLAGGLLAYPGAAPVNAPLFWAMTVGWQLLMLLIVGAAWCWQRGVGRVHSAQGVPGAGASQSLVWTPVRMPVRMLVRHAALAWGRALHHLPGERRATLRAAVALAVSRTVRHGPLLASATLAPLQRFGVALNIGLLAAMLAVHLPLVDLRFGWQSSYPITPGQMHGAVQALALPWRWLLPGAQPDVAAVAATRYSPGQSASDLAAAPARAWWPFLALSVACYGLLLRGLLLAWTRRLHRRQLAALAFDQPEAMALWRRLMLAPSAEASIQHPGPPLGTPFEAQAGTASLPAWQPVAPLPLPHQGRCVLLVSDDLADNLLDDHSDDHSDTRLDDPPSDVQPDAERLRHTLLQRFGWTVSARRRLSLDDRHAAADTLAALQSMAERPVAVAVLAPAERDPIVAVAQCLRAVVQAAGAGVETRLLLLATEPDASAERLQLWQRFLQIQRLPIGVETWQP